MSRFFVFNVFSPHSMLAITFRTSINASICLMFALNLDVFVILF